MSRAEVEPQVRVVLPPRNLRERPCHSYKGRQASARRTGRPPFTANRSRRHQVRGHLRMPWYVRPGSEEPSEHRGRMSVPTLCSGLYQLRLDSSLIILRQPLPEEFMEPM